MCFTKNLIEELASKYKYRPLPKKIKSGVLNHYATELTSLQYDNLLIGGVKVATKYRRVVVGDYGAYVEINPEDLLVNLTVPDNQKWRLDTKFCEERGLSLKYIWYTYLQTKVYFQLSTVKYADYLPNKYYISVLDFDKEKTMAGPAKAVNGETVRPKFNVMSFIDHALGSYIRGDDNLDYLNGGFAHIMGFGGRGNTFKTFKVDQFHATIRLRYQSEWWSKYDTEVSAELARAETANIAAYRENHVEYDPDKHSLMAQINTDNFNFNAADQLQGEDWYASYIRDEVEGRHKQYISGKNLRETPFPDPLREGKNRAILNPWHFFCDSLSEWHSSAVDTARDKSDVGSGDQNSLAMKDAKDKSDMMGRWPQALARGHFYMSFTVHVSDSIQMGRYAPDKKLDDLKANIKFSGVPGRALTFLTNSLIVATASGEMVRDKSYDSTRGVNEPMYPKTDSRGFCSSQNDLKVIRYTQFRAKSGPTGVKYDLIFSQEEGMLVGLSEWHYLKDVMKQTYGMERRGNFYTLALMPDDKFQRTTIRSEIESNFKLKRTLEILAAVCYMQNNWLTLEPELRLTADELYEGVIKAGYDWEEILTSTVEYWQFKDSAKLKGYKPTLTAKTLLRIAAGENVKPKFLTKK